jgi:hypothetical protein
MSGPKSVRYVSREELLATCQLSLERYKSRSLAWLKRISRGGLGEESDESLVTSVLKEFEKMLVEGDTRRFEMRMIEEVAWLDREFERRVDARTERLRKEQQLARRRVNAVSTVLAAAAKRPGAVPVDVLEVLQRIRVGEETDRAAINKAVNTAFAALASQEDKGTSETQSELAKQLGIGQSRRTIKDWVEEAAPEDEPSGSKLDHILSEMTLRFGAEAISSFHDQAARIALEADPHRRQLMINSLTIELAKFAREQADSERLTEQGQSILAGLRSNADAYSSVITDLEFSLKNKTGRYLQEAIDKAIRQQERHIAEKNLAHRRRLLLDTLSKLGYEIEEGMEAAFAKEGRVIVERAARPGYGVELSGLIANERLQVRAMRFDDVKGSGASDLEHETEWCSTFSDLRAILGQAGNKIVIEKALGIGARPLKVVERGPQRRIQKRSQKTLD